MMLSTAHIVVILIAAAAAWVFGAVWYTSLSCRNVSRSCSSARASGSATRNATSILTNVRIPRVILTPRRNQKEILEWNGPSCW